MKRLQVLINGNWEFVFCRNSQQAKVITCNKEKAIHGDADSLAYFQRWFVNMEFRII